MIANNKIVSQFSILILAFSMEMLHCRLIITNPNGDQVMNVSAPQWKWSHSWTEANGSVIDASSRDQYCGDGEESWRGNIIFMGEGSGCSEEHKNQICLNWNCSGIILTGFTVDPGIECLRSMAGEASSNSASFTIPMVMISLYNGLDLQSKLVDEHLSLNAYFTAGDPNPWSTLFNTIEFIIIWNVILTALSVFTIIFASVRLIQLGRAGRLTRWATYCFVAELIAACLRVIVWAVPDSEEHYPFFVFRLTLTITFPITISTSYAIVYIWVTALRGANVSVGWFTPSRQRIVYGFFVFVSLVCFIVESIAAFAAASYFDPTWMYTIAAFFDGIAFLFLLIALLIFGIFTRNQLKSLIDRRLKAMTRFITASAIGMSLFVLAGICSLFEDIWGVPLGYSILMWFFYVGLAITSISNVSAFVASTTRKSKSAGEMRSQPEGSKVSSTNFKSNQNDQSKTVEVDTHPDHRTNEVDAAEADRDSRRDYQEEQEKEKEKQETEQENEGKREE